MGNGTRIDVRRDVGSGLGMTGRATAHETTTPAWAIGALAAAVLLSACGGGTDAPASADTGGAPAAATADAAPGAAATPTTDATGPDAVTDDDATEAATDTTEDAGFALDRVPVSTVPLGDFPYFQLPEGYVALSAFTREYPFDRVGFWTGEAIEWVEGRFHVSHIRSDGSGYSPLQVERNIAAVVEQAGGVHVFSGVEPREVREALWAGTDSFPTRYRNSVCFATQPVHVYVVRRADRAIWVRQCSNGDKGGGWVIGETEAFQATATLLPRQAIEQALGETGRVALQVNFATDQADVLPDSLPQIDEIVALLEADPALRLAIEGHTDDTGPAARNRTLAQARAEAVVALVVARGIAADRLEAAGYGPDRPVADNATEDGKAQNRRVELVSLQ